jgi:hypothetical protein
MMTPKIYQELLDARITHQQWVLRVKHLIENAPVDVNQICIDEKSCEFGQWIQRCYEYFHDSKQLKFILQSIENYHNDLHQIYLKIYTIYSKELQLPFGLSTIVGIQKKPNLQQQKLLSFMFLEIEELSKSMFKELDILEQTLKRSDSQEV